MSFGITPARFNNLSANNLFAALAITYSTCAFHSKLLIDVIYQTRETVFHRDIQTPRRELKIRRAAEYF